MPSDVVGLLKNRAVVMAFLTTDDRPRYRRFAHSQLLNYFLCQVTIDAIGKKDVPKFVRRNIFGADFLADFCDALMDAAGSDEQRVKNFLNYALEIGHAYLNTDRGARNLGALLFAALPVADLKPGFHITGMEVDDAVVHGTATDVKISRTSVSQLDLRGASVEAVNFSEVVVVWLIADRTCVFSTFPVPMSVKDESLGSTGVVTERQAIQNWVGNITPGTQHVEVEGILPEAVRAHGLYRLLGRACRLRQSGCVAMAINSHQKF